MIITTNIRLPEEQWKSLKIMAVHAGTSVSALVRQAIGGLLQAADFPSKQTPARQKTLKRDPFYDVIGLGSGGPSDDSTRHDHYLYMKK